MVPKIIDISIYYGNFDWCGINATYYLSNRENPTISNIYYIEILFAIDNKFLQKCKTIEIYNDKKLIHYNRGNLTNIHIAKFLLPEEKMNKKFTIQFGNLAIVPNSSNFLKRLPLIIYYYKSIKIKKLKIYGEDKECPICWGNIPEEFLYISKCGHRFCIQCIFQYNEALDNLIPSFHRYCFHAEYIRYQFRCPICKSLTF